MSRKKDKKNCEKNSNIQQKNIQQNSEFELNENELDQISGGEPTPINDMVEKPKQVN